MAKQSDLQALNRPYIGEPLETSLDKIGGKTAACTNIDPAHPKAMKLAMRVARPGDFNADTIGDQRFDLVHWYVHRVEVVATKTGELVDALRTVLIDTDGATLAFVSDGIVRSLDIIRQFRGEGPYDPPVPVQVLRHKSRTGGQVLSLEVLED